ncbi:hypothetical protein DEJ25_13605 [Curtobacterium sp. MCPF17_011]|uniref:hypothetical protein n=1 Tax=Curtobacterium sp. MCPF17_011 TaxID=2175652 RepID=UPI000DA8496C|nr:hypothetical protein [Curtobacterium sp. MCPF17_011]PZF10004.1 hypothetical protein DEJ25_13605 [Curtobacterium sp. MCPF17_011]
MEASGDPVAGSSHYNYTPKMPAEMWTRIGGFVRETVRSAAPKTPYTEKQLYPVTAMLTRWAVETAGYPLKVKMLFHPATVDQFSRQGLVAYTNAGRATMRSKLRSMATALLGPDRAPDAKPTITRSGPSAPYDEREIASLLSWASVQRSPERRSSAHALLALGLGMGLTGREICEVKAEDVHRSDEAVELRVGGANPRRVVVIREWEDALRDRFDFMEGAGWLFRAGQEGGNANLITDFVSRNPGRVHLQARRMRATWIVRHLTSGTPLPVLIAAAGVQSAEAFDRLLPFVAGRDWESDRRFLRDA